MPRPELFPQSGTIEDDSGTIHRVYVSQIKRAVEMYVGRFTAEELAAIRDAVNTEHLKRSMWR